MTRKFNGKVSKKITFYLVATLLLQLILMTCGVTPTQITSAKQPLATDVTTPLPSPVPVISTPTHVYPDYLPFVTKSDIPPQTINGVTAVIDWTYADVSHAVFSVHLSGWEKNYLVDSVVLQNKTGGVSIEANSYITSSIVGSDFSNKIEFMPEIELRPGTFTGQLILHISALPDEQSVAEFKFDLNLKIYPATGVNVGQTVNANGLDIFLQSARVTPTYTALYICFKKPSSADWHLGNSSLRIGENNALFGGLSLLSDLESGYINENPESDWAPPAISDRCEKGAFLNGHHNKPITMIFTIKELEQSIPEVIPNSDVQKTQEELKKEGIEISYIQASHNSTWNITKKPDGMSDEDVMHLFYSKMGFYYPGPWTFTFQVIP